MGKSSEYAKSMNIGSSIDEAIDAKLSSAGRLTYTPPEAPVQTYEDSDIERGGEIMANAAMPILFQEERQMIKQTLMSFVTELRNDDEGPIRISDDFSFNIPDKVVDQLLEAYLEDSIDGEDEDDEGAEDFFGGDFASNFEGFQSEVEDDSDRDTEQST